MNPSFRPLWRASMIAGVLAWLLNGPIGAADVQIEADRTRVVMGESFHVRITVRGALSKPNVMMPQIPACQVERVPEASPTGTASAGTKSPPARNPTDAAVQSLMESIEKAEEETLRALSEKLGQYDQLLMNSGAFEVLRETRRQALQALQQGRGKGDEYRFAFRITPQRAGVLTLPPFVVQADGRTLQTQPVEITVEPSPTSASVAPPSQPSVPEPSPPPETEAPAVLADRSWDRLVWMPLVSLGTAVVLGIALAFLWPMRRRREQPTPGRAVSKSLGGSAGSAPPATPRRLHPGSRADEIHRSLTDVLRVLCDLPPGEITAHEAVAAMTARGMQSSLVRQVEEILFQCEVARFAPTTVAEVPDGLAQQAQRLIAELVKLAEPVTDPKSARKASRASQLVHA